MLTPGLSYYRLYCSVRLLNFTPRRRFYVNLKRRAKLGPGLEARLPRVMA